MTEKHRVTSADLGFDVLATTKRSQAATMVLEPGESTGGPDNAHEDADQWLYVIGGEAEVEIDGEDVEVKPGELLLIPAGETHEVRSVGEEPLRTLNVYSAPTF